MKFNILAHFLLFVSFAAASIAKKPCVCPAGYVHVKPDTCAPCKPGTFQPNPGKDSCKPCPTNTAASESGATFCQPCGKFSTKEKNTATKCVCKPGSGFVNLKYPDIPVCQIKRCGPGEFPGFRGRTSMYAFCIPCFTGTFGIVKPDGTSACRKCPKGKVSLQGATSCTRCPKGEFLTMPGVCGKKCPAGTEVRKPSTSTSTCDMCPEGTFKKDPGNFECQRCRSGTYSLLGATNCTSCPPGKRPLLKEGKLKCGTCPPGKEYDVNIAKCNPCFPGRYKPTQSIMKCFKCPEGSYSLPGATECIKCPRGKALMKNGRCGSCPPRTYYEKFVGKCLKCFADSYSPGGNIEECIPCKRKEHSKEGASECIKCPTGTAFIEEKGTCELCPAGFHVPLYTKRCEKCYDGVTSEPNVDTECKPCGKGEIPINGNTACAKVCKVNRL